MTNAEIITRTVEFVRGKFEGEGSGHDWWHMYRVWQTAKTIAAKEPAANKYVIELAALLHDIADWKFNDGDDEAGPRAAREWLESQAVDGDVILQVEDIIRTVSFKGAGVKEEMKTLEGKIIFDADKLDAMGAIGVARLFAFGGSVGREIYNPEVVPEKHDSYEAYKKSPYTSTSINHFYEKLLLLKGRMQTETGRQMAEQRHEFMEQFLDQFYAEWKGER